MTVPRAFLSYAWEPSTRSWVRSLATTLRADGINVVLDLWEAVPGDGLPAFMETQVRESDFVLVVCTPKYKEKSEARTGGVGYEGDVMTAEVFTGASRRKFIPIHCAGEWRAAAPSWLAGAYYIDLTSTPLDQTAYQDLLDTLHGRREAAPPIGAPRHHRGTEQSANGVSSRASPQGTLDARSLQKKSKSKPAPRIVPAPTPAVSPPAQQIFQSSTPPTEPSSIFGMEWLLGSAVFVGLWVWGAYALFKGPGAVAGFIASLAASLFFQVMTKDDESDVAEAGWGMGCVFGAIMLTLFIMDLIDKS